MPFIHTLREAEAARAGLRLSEGVFPPVTFKTDQGGRAVEVYVDSDVFRYCGMQGDGRPVLERFGMPEQAARELAAYLRGRKDGQSHPTPYSTGDCIIQ